MRTDLQVLALLRKRAASSKAAADEAAVAKRSDLRDKEEAQIGIFDEYASQVETMPDEDVETIIRTTMNGLGDQANPGAVIKALFSSGGPLDGKSVERAKVAALVKKLSTTS